MALLQPAQPPAPIHNESLLPNSKHDEEALDHLQTLDPSEWTHLILYTPSIPSVSSTIDTHVPAIDHSAGLLTWLQDINWPIAVPTSKLLLNLVNDPEKRDTHGQLLVGVLKRTFNESEDWDWCYYLVTMIVTGMEDKVWMRSVFGDVLGEFGKRIPPQAEADLGFKEEIQECLGGGARDGKGEQ